MAATPFSRHNSPPCIRREKIRALPQENLRGISLPEVRRKNPAPS
jgi:hypothetical protein